jgi:hypothetical protein
MKMILKKLFDGIPKKIRLPLFVLLKSPNKFFPTIRPDTPFWAKFYFDVMMFVYRNDVKKRNRLVDSIEFEEDVKIEVSKGYLVRNLLGIPIADKAIACCKDIVNKLDIEELSQKSKKSFLLQRDMSPNDPAVQPVFDLACDPMLVKPIAKYLGVTPVLHSAQIWISPNEQHEEGRSQDYHFDGEDKRQIKCFVNIEEVTEDSGPFTLIAADQSQEIYQKLRNDNLVRARNVKVDDTTVYGTGVVDQGISVCGETGMSAMVDTSKCYHYGSRPASKRRVVLQLHYCSPFSAKLPAWGRQNDYSFCRDGLEPQQIKIREAVLGLHHLALRASDNFK